MNVGQKTIFFVDDDMTNLSVGNDTLSRYYNVFTFNSAARLLKMLESHTPDLILLDIEMPEIDGYEAIKLIKGKAETKDIPVIFLTAYSDAESELKGLSLGAIDYIIKPFSPPLLLKRIEVHLLVESQKKQLINFSNNLQVMVDTKTKTVVELKNALLKTMAELVEYRDDITGEHINRTETYMRILLEALRHHDSYKNTVLNWDTEQILQSTQLHDVGKIATKDTILQKKSKLTKQEFEEIKAHVTFGEKIIDKIKSMTTERTFLEQAKILISTHHEKWDGSGYPRGLKGENIPLQGRLMAIADVYDALVSKRSYKNPYSHKEAVKIIQSNKGMHFDPALVDVFLSVADKFEKVSMNTK